MSRPLTIGLLWHSATSDNLGIGALTVAQIAILRALAARGGHSLRLRILGWTDPRPPYVTAPDVEQPALRTRDLMNGRFLRAARGCDLVLDIAAGDSFADIYGAKRFAKIMGGKAMVHLARRPLILSPQTIGPFRRGWARRAAFASLSRSEAVFARDALSITALREAGWQGPVVQACDVAFKLPYERPAHAPGGPVRVGLNISGLLMRGGYTGANMFGLRADYPALMRGLAARFAAMDGVELHLVPHVITERIPVECDWTASRELAEDLGPGVVLAPRFAGPSEAKSYIAGLDFFAGARMHACIAALSSGVPVVPIAYSRKFDGLFGTLGYTHTADCRHLDTAAATEAVLAGFAARAQLAKDARAAFETGLARLAPYEEAVSALMARAASRG